MEEVGGGRRKESGMTGDGKSRRVAEVWRFGWEVEKCRKGIRATRSNRHKQQGGKGEAAEKCRGASGEDWWKQTRGTRVFTCKKEEGATRSLTLETTAQLPLALHSRLRHLLGRAAVGCSLFLSSSLFLPFPLYRPFFHATLRLFTSHRSTHLLYLITFDICWMIRNMMFKATVCIYSYHCYIVFYLFLIIYYSTLMCCSLLLLFRAFPSSASTTQCIFRALFL